MSILKGLALVDIIQQLHTCACILSSPAFVPTLHGHCCSVLRLSVPVHLHTQALLSCMPLLKSAAFFQQECPHPTRAQQCDTSRHSDHVRLPLLQVGI